MQQFGSFNCLRYTGSMRYTGSIVPVRSPFRVYPFYIHLQNMLCGFIAAQAYHEEGRTASETCQCCLNLCSMRYTVLKMAE